MKPNDEEKSSGYAEPTTVPFALMPPALGKKEFGGEMDVTESFFTITSPSPKLSDKIVPLLLMAAGNP
jgi:hypothetical protein